MKTSWIVRRVVGALLLLTLMLAPLGAGATAKDREKPGRAKPSEVALENARGLALGFRDPGGSPAAVPEPSGALLFAGGLLVAGATRRLRRR